MGKEAENIQRDIEQTRADMSETVDELAYKMDVPARTKEAFHRRTDAVMHRITGRGHDVADTVSGRGHDIADTVSERSQHMMDTAKERGHRMKSMAERNPLGLAVGAVATGFLLGLLIPTSRVEEEKLGPMASEFTDRAREAGGEAIRKAGDTAAERVSEQIEENVHRVAGQVEETMRRESDELGRRVQEGGH